VADSEAKRIAARALRGAGRRHLADHGVRQASSRPRQWLRDGGWWLINIEFQPSGWSLGSYLNVGLQHLWQRANHRYFGYSSRTPIAGIGQFVDLVGEEDAALAGADAVASSARAAVQEWLDRLDGDPTHLMWLSERGGDDGDIADWPDFDAAVAHGILGHTDAAHAAFDRLVAQADDPIPWIGMRAEPSRGQDDSKEPPPRVAHQQRRSAGEVTTATSVVP
jgi:hypothetical protein